MHPRHCIFTALLCASLFSCAGPPSMPHGSAAIPAATMPLAASTLTIQMAGGKTVILSLDDFAKLPHESVHVTDHDGTAADYDGVALGRLLAAVDAPLGENLRGKNLALYIVAEGADGYKAAYSIVEADAAFGHGQIIVADRRNGQPLSDKARPLEVIVPEDKMQARWVRMLVALRIHRAE